MYKIFFNQFRALVTKKPTLMTKKPDITQLPMTTQPELLTTELTIETHTIVMVLMPAEDTIDLELTKDKVLMLTDLKDMIILPMDVTDEVMNIVTTLLQVLPVPTNTPLPQHLPTTMLQLTQLLFIMLQLTLPHYNMLL